MGFVNYAFSGALFVASLFYMLQSDVDLIDRVVDLLPLTLGKATYILFFFLSFLLNCLIVCPLLRYRRVIMNYIRGIFVASFWSFWLNAIGTGVVFFFFGIQRFFFTSMLMAGVCAMFPVVPVWIVFLPPAINFFAFNSLMMAGLVLAAGFALSWLLAPLVYLMVPYSHPYVTGLVEEKKRIILSEKKTGLSLVLGLYTYGLEGVLLGPLIVCLSLIILSILREEKVE